MCGPVTTQRSQSQNNYMNGIIYCRVSSKEQTQGTSLESQEQACRKYAHSKHIGVLKVFVEQGESAKFADRTQLLELIEFSRKNKGNVELLLVWKVDRFARNVADHFKVKAELLKYGVRIVSVTEPIDTNAEGKLMETILAGFAQFDNDIRAMRTVQGMKRKLQEGLFPWKPPLGYKTSTTNGEKKTKPDLPDPDIFKNLQKAWHDYATGAYTKADIRRLLYTWGIGGANGKPLPAQSIDNLFRNPYYAGTLIDPWSGDEYSGQHPPMVSREVFQRVQRIIAGKSRSVSHVKDRPEFPLRGFVRCSSCRRHLTGSFSRGRTERYAYYRCGNRECASRSKSIPVATVQHEFETLLSQIAPRSGIVDKLCGMILKVIEKRDRFDRQRMAQARVSLAQIDEESQELIRMRAQGLITDSEFIAQKRVLADRRSGAEASIDDQRFRLNDLKKQMTQIAEPITRLHETWQHLPTPLSMQFQQLILPVGFVAGQNGTAELGCLFKLFGHLDGDDSTVGCLMGIEPTSSLPQSDALPLSYRHHQRFHLTKNRTLGQLFCYNNLTIITIIS